MRTFLDWIKLLKIDDPPSNVHLQTGPFKLQEKPPNSAHNTGDKLEHYRLTMALQMGRKAREREAQLALLFHFFSFAKRSSRASTWLMRAACYHQQRVSLIMLQLNYCDKIANVETIWIWEVHGTSAKKFHSQPSVRQRDKYRAVRGDVCLLSCC